MSDLSSVVLLAARTSRSQAYLQALADAALRVGAVYGATADAQPVPPALVGPRRQLGQLLLPDLGEDIETTAQAMTVRTTNIECSALDNPELIGAVQALKPSLIVFSGYPSQLVPGELRAIAPVLHVHGGALPGYRGSTTIYYSILAGDRPEATALLVDDGIDSGQVVQSIAHPPPPADVDIDHLFDGALRASVLVDVLRQFADQGHLSDPHPQPDDGRLHFIIHPVLKRLALDRRPMSNAG